MNKTKSKHHQAENTFKFLTLNERLANIKIDVGRQINRYNTKPEETETYFALALEKWVDLNYTGLFYEFTVKVKKNCQTLAQLIYSKDQIVDLLVEYLAKSNELQLQPLLDLTVQLSRDLQNDFYSYFPRLFSSITKLLETQNTDILEWSYQALSYLFKFLWRYMLKDLDNVYTLYSPLFEDARKEYIRNFSAESFAFLMRKAVDKNELFNFLIDRLIKHQEESKGIGRLIFEMFKGIKKQFNSCTEHSFAVLLDKLNCFKEDNEENESKNELVFNCICYTVESMAEFTSKEHSSIIWKCFFAKVTEWKDEPKKLNCLMQLMITFISQKDCYLIDNLDSLLENLSKISQYDFCSNEELKLTKSFLDLSKMIFLSKNVQFSIEKISFLPKIMFQTKYDYNLIIELTKSLFSSESFESVVMPNLLKYFNEHLTIKPQSNIYIESIVSLLSEYLLEFKKIVDINTNYSSEDDSNYFNILSRRKNLAQFKRLLEDNKLTGLQTNLTKYFNDLVLEKDDLKINQIEFCTLAPLFSQNQFEKLVFNLSKNTMNKLNIQFETLKEHYLDDKPENSNTYELECLLFSLSVWSLMHFDNNKEDMFRDCIDNKSLFDCLVNLVLKLDDLKSEIITKKNLYQFELEKHFIHLLRALNYFLSLNFDSTLSDKLHKQTEQILHFLKKQLSSPYHENRFHSLNILNWFYKNEQSNEAIEDSLFKICLNAETTAASLDEYRQKVYHLQRLDADICKKYFQNNQLQEISLRYLFGVLFENFKLLWQPLVVLIQSYANNMNANDFWNILGEHLNLLNLTIETKIKNFETEPKPSGILTTNDLVDKLAYLRVADDLNIDYSNTRYLICRSMQGFPNNCESKTRILIPNFFRFLNNEYYKFENQLLSNSFEDITSQLNSEYNKKKKEKFFSKVLLNKYLCGYLDIFAKFTSPKSWYLEEKLRDLYFNLLCHSDFNVQKSTLNCLCVYKYPYLITYKENLERLLEGKYFRRELVLFSLDENAGIIHQDHRSDLLPILMRILYGKFHSHESTHTSSKDTKSNKRSVIIQFLSSCSESELGYFFDLLFGCITKMFEQQDESNLDNFIANLQLKLNTYSGIDTIYTLNSIIPLKKLLGILDSLDIVIKKLARRMENFSHRLLQILSFVHKYALSLYEIGNGSIQFENKTKSKKLISDFHMNLLRIIRQKVTLRFKQFFENFDHLNFNQSEYFFVFESFIWPLSLKLKNESLKSVSNLLKIFSLWSERSIYYPLFTIKLEQFNLISTDLVKQLSEKQSNIYENMKSRNVLDILFELVDSNNCSRIVIDYVIEIVHNLVTFADYKPEQLNDDETIITKALPFEFNNINENGLAYDSNEMNFGTIILKPYVGSIINHIEKIVDLNISKKTLPTRPLKILARISCFASESNTQCERIIQLLVPYLIKNRKESEEAEINILNSINHLIIQVRNVGDFICPLSRLFAIIKNRQSQVELINIFKKISEIDPKYENIAKLVHNLNAWDPKRLEEPDYMLRLDAFKSLNQLIDEWTSFDMNLASILIYNCVSFLHSIEDLALKESSTNCVNLFLKKASELELKKSDLHLFETNFVNEIKNGLRSKTESVRHEFIKIFVEYIQLFKSKFKNLEQFCVLMDHEDVEKDFFENIKHIQMHRRSRALKRLQRACFQNEISSENLLHYMMPIAKSFIENEQYEKYDYIIEEACNSIGAICYVLNWAKYLKIVEYYIKILPKSIMNPKIVTKVLISVLDAFHFDLSNTTVRNKFELEEPSFAKPDESGDEPRKKTLVSKELAFKIHTTISKTVLPVLFKGLTKRLTSESEHKMNKQEDQDGQILRVPMALAILKLIKNLPLKTFETHLPGLLFKVCEMLKSRSMSVRNTTRECLMKMINSLPGIGYYHYVFKELSNSLTRGFQVHVLCYTVHFILKNVQETLKLGDLDTSIECLVQTCILEIFSNSVSEEKETKKILAKTFEAKMTSSYNTLEIIGKYLSPSQLLNLVRPFKQKLEEFNSDKWLKKVEESLRRIQLGILSNTGLDNETLMLFSYGLLNDFFDAAKLKKYQNGEAKNKVAQLENSCLIIPHEPKRGGDKPKISNKTNQHIIAEFSLQVLNHMIKQNRLTQETKTTEMLEPFLPLLVEHLEGKYPKLTIISIRCINGFLNYNLRSLPQHINQIASQLFVLMRTYSNSSQASHGDNSTDNFELLMVCYKLIAAIIKNCSYFRLSNEQLTMLMYYAERNLYDNSKQPSAFNLIKSILSRKIQSEELTDILSKIMKLSIQAESANVRLQSRQIILQYMLEFSFGEKKLSKLLEFYIIQLDYEYENGRESALEMLATIFNTFPQAQVNLYASMFFLPLAIQLHNDNSSKCKKLAHIALKYLLEKISIEQRDELFMITLALFKDNNKPLHKRIAALLVKIFVEIECYQFERRLDQFLDFLYNEINFDNFSQNMELLSSVTEKFYDQYLFNILTLLMKIFKECKVYSNSKYCEISNKIYDQVKLYLTYEHSWVRLVSCQLFGQLFSNFTIDELVTSDKSYFKYSSIDYYAKIRDLIDSFCSQLHSPILDTEIADQVVKNLAFMAKLIKKYPFNEPNEVINHEINMEWLIKKVIKEANYELVKTPKETIKRTSIFKLLAAIAIDLGKESLKQYLNLIIICLQRESLTEQADENLKKLAQEVLDLIKNTVGVEEFSMFYSKSITKRIENKEDRKRKLAQIAVTDPQLAALKKIRKMQRKKETKKRKRTGNNPHHKNSKKMKNDDQDDY